MDTNTRHFTLSHIWIIQGYWTRNDYFWRAHL